MEPPPPPAPSDQTKPSPHRFIARARDSHNADGLQPRASGLATDQARAGPVQSEPSTGIRARPRFTTGSRPPQDHGLDHTSKRLKVDDQPSTPTTPRFMLTPRTEHSSIDRPRPVFHVQGDHRPLSIDPRPNIFSPQKHHHRYVAGGMAVQLQSWLTEIDTAARNGPNGTNIIRVEACEGEQLMFIKGTDTTGTITKAMLVRGAAHSSSPHHLPIGARVELQGPTWPVDLGGKSWTVVADWKMLP